jgi:hypothetical protein
MAVLLLILTFAVLVVVDRLLVCHRRVKEATGLERCASGPLCVFLVLLLSASAAAALALPATTPPAMDRPSTFWLDLTNAALGLITLACLVAVAAGVLKELASRGSVDSRR